MYILYKDNDSKIQPLVYIIIYVKEAQKAKQHSISKQQNL